MGFEEHKPTIVMIVCQFIYSGVTLSSRAALLEDMSSSVFVVYRQCTAFLLIAPFAFLTRRQTKSCSLGWKNFGLIFLLSFVGVTANQNVYFQGLYLSSSSVASALGNLVPAITFLMAYIMGLEKVQARSLRSVAKVVGTVFCVSGAVAMALLKGPKLLNMEYQPRNLLFLRDSHEAWLLGCFLLFASACFWSIWLILQVHVSASYPDHLSLTAYMCLFAAMQSAVLTLIFEPDKQAWILNSPLQIISCLYAGLGSAITFFAQAWCISRRGPLFSAMFNPLVTVIVTVSACLFMHEEMYTGSLMGALMVMIGLYVVLWGKAKDHQQELNGEATDLLKEQNDEHASLFYTNDIENNAISCNTDLEDPLLDKTSSNFVDDTTNEKRC